MEEQITLSGPVTSPINPNLWTYGTGTVQFELSGGTRSGGGAAIWGAQVTDFRVTLAGQTWSAPALTANYQLSSLPDNSGLVVWGPQNSELVWLFSGSTWNVGPGLWQTEENAYDIQFNHVQVSYVDEPSVIAVAVVAAIVYILAHFRRGMHRVR